MARPSNEELMEERRAIAEILGTQEGETNAEAAQRLVAQRDASIWTLDELVKIIQPGHDETLMEAADRLAELKQGAKDASGAHIPAGAGSIPAPATFDDDNPNDPRPAMDPILGWRTPAVEAWVARRNLKTA